MMLFGNFMIGRDHEFIKPGSIYLLGELRRK
jgi:hypothetical protein